MIEHQYNYHCLKWDASCLQSAQPPEPKIERSLSINYRQGDWLRNAGLSLVLSRHINLPYTILCRIVILLSFWHTIIALRHEYESGGLLNNRMSYFVVRRMSISSRLKFLRVPVSEPFYEKCGLLYFSILVNASKIVRTIPVITLAIS